MKLVRRFVRFVAIGLVALAMSLSLLIITQSIFCPFHVVVSDSMSPQIKTGDAVIIKDIEPGDIEVGQVVIFHNPEFKGEFIIHRVVEIEDTGKVRYFTTKGDNNAQVDEDRVPTGEVVGGVAVNIPSFGRILNFVSTPEGYFACIAAPGVIALMMVALLAMFEKARKRRAIEKQGTGYRAYV